jgi:hypothetical protein
MKPYTPPEPDYRRLSDLQSGIDNWYSPTTLRAAGQQYLKENGK